MPKKSKAAREPVFSANPERTRISAITHTLSTSNPQLSSLALTLQPHYLVAHSQNTPIYSVYQKREPKVLLFGLLVFIERIRAEMTTKM